MKLVYKFFLAFFITNLALVGLLLGLIAFNLSTSFTHFVTSLEDKHLIDAEQQLISLYRQNNSWQPILDNVQIWRDIVDPKTQNHQRRDAQNQESILDKSNLQKAISYDFLQTGKRISLYDHNKKMIVGKLDLTDNPVSQSIELNGEIIGWLGLEPSRLVENSPASEFLTHQYKSYYLMAGTIFLLAFIMALLLSKHLIGPIKQLINGTNKLIQGDYKNRIEVTREDELGVLSNHVNVLADTLGKNQNNRFQWMSDTSHELRTPLTVLRAQLIAIQDGIFVANEERIQLFIDEIDNLSRIVDDLYQLSSSDAGGLTYLKIELNPITLLLQVIDSFSVKFEQQSFAVNTCSLEKLLTDKHCKLLADKDRLRQLFANVLENSCRYTQAPGNINISAQLDKHCINIVVQDSAPGVSAKAQEKLFDRFYRVEPSRNRNHGGSGLGLSLCKQIVEAHQGTITVFDSPLGGLSIKMTFPLLKNNSR